MNYTRYVSRTIFKAFGLIVLTAFLFSCTGVGYVGKGKQFEEKKEYDQAIFYYATAYADHKIEAEALKGHIDRIEEVINDDDSFHKDVAKAINTFTQSMRELFLNGEIEKMSQMRNIEALSVMGSYLPEDLLKKHDIKKEE